MAQRTGSDSSLAMKYEDSKNITRINREKEGKLKNNKRSKVDEKQRHDYRF